MKRSDIEIREIRTFEEMDACIEVQLEVFKFPDIDASPVRQFVTTRHSGGFTLGAFAGRELIGLILTSPALRGREAIFYSNMAAVRPGFQGCGIGAALKWAQRQKALELGVKFIKWTFQPVQARNAFFNIEKLGALVREYIPNYYGTGFSNSGVGGGVPIDSDRLFAEWELESEKVRALAEGAHFSESGECVKTIKIPADWNTVLRTDPSAAVLAQTHIKNEFQTAFSEGLVARNFQKDPQNPHFRLFAA